MFQHCKFLYYSPTWSDWLKRHLSFVKSLLLKISVYMCVVLHVVTVHSNSNYFQFMYNYTPQNTTERWHSQVFDAHAAQNQKKAFPRSCSTEPCPTKKTNNLWIVLFPGIGASLKSLLKDADATVRHKATEVLGIVAGIMKSSYTFTSLEKKMYITLITYESKVDHGWTFLELWHYILYSSFHGLS